jgi:hypothetical protein
MHFLLLAYLCGDEQVFVTITSPERSFAGDETELRALRDGIRVDAR